MEETPADDEAAVHGKIVEQIIPGASPELVREVVEDQLQHTIPKPASDEVEEERIRRAQAEER